ncbi:MAG: cbb3-type cytochrome oxidase assembly protein CcoS [Thermoanaerobaculia bacterium]|nr:MAG: cbb3-type cytochrome oxidase assembly protein CcoS [Thermoanaerobaculia bacterium]
MEVLFFLVPLAALFAGLIVAALVWAVRSGQFEDLEGPAHRILMDDDGRPPGAERAPGTDRGQGDDPRAPG